MARLYGCRLSDLTDIERFLTAEAALLDEGRFEAWLELFAPDGTYWVPAQPEQPDPLDHVSLFYEDRALLAMRIERLRHPDAHALAVPIRTSRLVGNAAMAEPVGADLVVRSRFQLLEQQGERQRLFAGAYTHRLARADGIFRIRQKRVDLVGADSAHEPIQIIF
jgi:benzoate/toluate 1,2-dioxygenase beta subunit